MTIFTHPQWCIEPLRPQPDAVVRASLLPRATSTARHRGPCPGLGDTGVFDAVSSSSWECNGYAFHNGGRARAEIGAEPRDRPLVFLSAGVPGAAAKRDACRSFVGVAVPGLPEHLRTHPP